MNPLARHLWHLLLQLLLHRNESVIGTMDIGITAGIRIGPGLMCVIGVGIIGTGIDGAGTISIDK